MIPKRNISAALANGPRLDAAAAKALSQAVERLRQAGIPIATSRFGRIEIEQPKSGPGDRGPSK